jgi:hypothetical protein
VTPAPKVATARFSIRNEKRASPGALRKLASPIPSLPETDRAPSLANGRSRAVGEILWSSACVSGCAGCGVAGATTARLYGDILGEPVLHGPDLGTAESSSSGRPRPRGTATGQSGSGAIPPW